MSLRQAMDKLMEDSFIRPSRLMTVFGESPLPAVDMYETAKELVVKVNVPGVKAEELDIHLNGDVLTIIGERKSEEEEKKEGYYYQEQRYGSFQRAVSLPPNLKTDKAEAALEDGILTLKIPKTEATKPKAIKVTPKPGTTAKKVSTGPKAKAAKPPGAKTNKH